MSAGSNMQLMWSTFLVLLWFLTRLVFFIHNFCDENKINNKTIKNPSIYEKFYIGFPCQMFLSFSYFLNQIEIVFGWHL